MRPPERRWVVIALLTLPLVGLGLLLAVPALDLRWQHQPSHFWLVLVAAAINVALGIGMGVAADQHGDTRMLLVSLVLLTSAGFLGLHALATPGVLLAGPSVGFAIATPVGLVLAAPLALVSAREPPRPDAVPLARLARGLRVAVVVVVIAWGVGSVTQAPGLRADPAEAMPGWLTVAAVVALALYLVAARGYLGMYRRRGRALPLAVAVAFVLLAEALVALLVGRTWHLSWWEWHVLMTVAFAAILLATRAEFRRGRSVTDTFAGLYLDQTLAKIEAQPSTGLRALVDAMGRGEPTTAVTERLRRDGASAEQVRALERSAAELVRTDQLLRSYVGPRLADELAERPGMTRLGGQEVEISVLFADLVAFTSFSEGRPANEVITMLNAYWAAVVPVIVDDAGGMIDRFAGDAVLAVFNALGDQPDHALRACRAAIGVRDAVAAIAAGHPGWPRFRLGVHSGHAVVGNVGTTQQHSFTAIGDTVNTAARVQALAEPGTALVSATTYAQARHGVVAVPRGAFPVKGRRDPVDVFELERTAPG